MSLFKLIETKNNKIVKYKDQIFNFSGTLNTRGNHTLWICTIDGCRAYIKLNNDCKQITEENLKHSHSNSKRRIGQSSTSSSSGSSLPASPNLSRLSSWDSSTTTASPGTGQDEDLNASAETVIAAPKFITEELLPDNHSILSMGTPASDTSANTINVATGSSTFSETPLIHNNVNVAR
uniref:FLYWCH-type domain-containing protein n=1 Tax=Cacopsylla melanoneura TaxID=428564 RepID=A0A8D8RI55_9HEMI